MRTLLLRRHLPVTWRRCNRVAMALVVLELIAFATALPARAETAVTVVRAQQQQRYGAERAYAGRSVPGRASELGFKTGGEIARMHVDVGDGVAAGDILAALDSAGIEAALQQAQADVALSVANLAVLEAETQLAAQTEARFRSLRASGSISAQLYDEQRLTLRAKRAQLQVARASLQRAEAARDAARILLDEASIRAPYAGIVQQRLVDEGTQVGPGQAIFRLVETSGAEAQRGHSRAGHRQPGARPGIPVRWNGRSYPATLSAVLPEIDPATRTLTAVLRLGDTDIPLGAVVELALQSEVPVAGYWLPVTALTESDRGLWGVFVVNDESTLERRLVEVLHAETERVYVRGTLAPGDRVVSTGVQRLVPGQKVAGFNAELARSRAAVPERQPAGPGG
ncbi:MAG: efflux RND transporter periplasmic adaptor subunit [Pseudomonadales bacterium]